MTKTLADYVPMLESIQDDPTNRLTPRLRQCHYSLQKPTRIDDSG